MISMSTPFTAATPPGYVFFSPTVVMIGVVWTALAAGVATAVRSGGNRVSFVGQAVVQLQEQLAQVAGVTLAQQRAQDEVGLVGHGVHGRQAVLALGGELDPEDAPVPGVARAREQALALEAIEMVGQRRARQAELAGQLPLRDAGLGADVAQDEPVRHRRPDRGHLAIEVLPRRPERQVQLTAETIHRRLMIRHRTNRVK